MSHFFKKSSKILLSRGFTLTELIVTISIVVVILTIVVSSQSTYTDRASVTNLADEISLSLFEAQAYGVGVREISTGSGDFSGSYGLTFRTTDLKQYIHFVDINDNDRYDGSWTCPLSGTCDEFRSKKVIVGGNTISEICLVRVNGSIFCLVDKVDISFARPNTAAQISFYNNGEQPYYPDNIAGARISLTSQKGIVKHVYVYKSGQISVQ